MYPFIEDCKMGRDLLGEKESKTAFYYTSGRK
jgi:hypothetical protein